LKGAKVTLLGTNQKTKTDKDGNFTLTDVDFSKYNRIQIEYNKQTKQTYFDKHKDLYFVFTTSNIAIQYQSAATDKYEVKGTVSDANGEALIAANVIIKKNGVVIAGGTAD
ncbi:MAG: hypothetical protein HC803_10060, partial [Saprospiraceae bacterium]|nr:hypothetical protein [Saprospiraceae bacterium]